MYKVTKYAKIQPCVPDILGWKIARFRRSKTHFSANSIKHFLTVGLHFLSQLFADCSCSISSKCWVMTHSFFFPPFILHGFVHMIEERERRKMGLKTCFKGLFIDLAWNKSGASNWLWGWIGNLKGSVFPIWAHESPQKPFFPQIATWISIFGCLRWQNVSNQA